MILESLPDSTQFIRSELKSKFAAYDKIRRRGPYPSELKRSVREAFHGGMTLGDISELTGRPQKQVQLWVRVPKSASVSLRRLRVVEKLSLNEAEAKRMRVIFPSGAYVELDRGSLASLLFNNGRRTGGV